MTRLFPNLHVRAALHADARGAGSHLVTFRRVATRLSGPMEWSGVGHWPAQRHKAGTGKHSGLPRPFPVLPAFTSFSTCFLHVSLTLRHSASALRGGTQPCPLAPAEPLLVTWLTAAVKPGPAAHSHSPGPPLLHSPLGSEDCACPTISLTGAWLEASSIKESHGQGQEQSSWVLGTTAAWS